jgi:hypothetical protein
MIRLDLMGNVLTTGESITYGDGTGENTARVEGVYQLSVNGAPPERVRYSGSNWFDGRFWLNEIPWPVIKRPGGVLSRCPRRIFALHLPGNLHHAFAVFNLAGLRSGTQSAAPSSRAYENEKLQVARPRS